MDCRNKSGNDRVFGVCVLIHEKSKLEEISKGSDPFSIKGKRPLFPYIKGSVPFSNCEGTLADQEQSPLDA
jgi:hypothetical protein